jgi:hypothetical protein
MRERLEEYLGLCQGYDSAFERSGYEYTSAVGEFDHAAESLQPTVQRIFAALDPRLNDDLTWLGYSTSNVDGRVRQALGILRDRDEWKRRLEPQAPSLAADQMHPIAWAAASPVWGTGQYRVAVQQATVALSAHIKARAGSHLNDRELVAQVFAPDPPKAGQVRLHLAGEPTDRMWQSQQQGLHLIAQGAFAGIRNVAVHDDVEWTQHEALEHLAVISVVARWAEQTTALHPR